MKRKSIFKQMLIPMIAIVTLLAMVLVTIIAAFLHDILEDTETEPAEIEKSFGSDVLKLVNGVTKLGKFQFKSKEERQAENFRRMFIAMAEDVRIIFLKLADRLHNMRTLNYMAANKQKRIDIPIWQNTVLGVYANSLIYFLTYIRNKCNKPNTWTKKKYKNHMIISMEAKKIFSGNIKD